MKKRFSGSLAAAALALTACGTTGKLDGGSSDAVAQSVAATAGVLDLNFAFGVPSAKIVVGPAQGRVEVFGLPGVADGTVYNGIRAINWRSGAGDDNVHFEVTQANDFDITVNPGTSNADIQTKWIIPAGASAGITPSLSIATGPGLKKVQVDLESFGRDVAFDLTGRMGAGDTDFKGNLQFKQGSVNAAANVDFQFSGANGDKAELLVDSEARNLNLSLSPRLMRELVAKVINDDPSDSATVNFSPLAPAAANKVLFEMVTSSPLVTLNHNVRGGAGMDDVSLGLTTLNRASVTSNVNIDLAVASDKLEMKYDGLPGNANVFKGPVALGGGDDEAKLEFRGLTNYGFTLDCGDGNDKAVGFLGGTSCEQR